MNVPAAVTTQRAYLAALRGDAEGTVAYASQALAGLGDDEWMLASHARGYLSLAEWMRGRRTEAEQLLSSITAQWRAAGERVLAVRGCHHLGQIQRAGGRLDAALGTYQQAVDIAAGPGRPHLPVAGPGYVGLAEVAYQQGELDAAAELATIGAGYAGKSLIRLAIRAGHQVAFAHAAELWHAERRLHLTVEPYRCGRCWPGGSPPRWWSRPCCWPGPRRRASAIPLLACAAGALAVGAAGLRAAARCGGRSAAG